MKRSLIYLNLGVYRLGMNLLYRGRYRSRYRNVFDVLGTGVGTVCEMCFGDTILADGCRARGIRWIGIDVNPSFCRAARRRGFDVREGDLLSMDLPAADAYVMVASLYHFHDRLARLLTAVFDRTKRLILSEPVQNLTNSKGLVGRLARRSADPGTGGGRFRYDEAGLLRALREQQDAFGFHMRVASVDRECLIEIERKSTG